ncbi:MAG: hypothetical protein R6V58_05495 [Planctomycetota bacterium]
MNAQAFLKGMLVLLVVSLAVTITSYVVSERNPARAQGGGGASPTDDWMMLASTLRQGQGLLYMFNARRDVLLVYAYHRGHWGQGSQRRFDADLEFLAGRHIKWDLEFAARDPFPRVKRHGVLTPAEVKAAVFKMMEEEDRRAKSRKKKGS